MINTALFIGDSHADPAVPNDRFTILGKYIAHKQPDLIVDIGDSADMPSLSRFDIGKRKAEGRRYDKDIMAYHDAMERIEREINRLNIKKKKRKEKLYNPRKVKTRGNHDHRIIRATNDDPKYWGTIKIEDLQEEKYGWEVYDFLTPVTIEGTTFSHYFPQGNYGTPIGGETGAKKLAKLDGGSKICGHSHILQTHYEGVGTPRWGMFIGCFLDPDYQIKGEAMDYQPVWVRQSWWNGVILVHSMENGMLHPTFVPYSYLLEKFG